MIPFFENLFSPEGFPPRWQCGIWSSGHGWLHIISDLAVFGAYTAIPIALVTLAWKKHHEMIFSKLVWLFGAFIFACGSVHLIEAIIFWHPMYRLAGVMKAFTALVSWATVIMLVRVLPQALKLPGLLTVNRQLEEALTAQKEATDALQQAKDRFSAVVNNVPGVVFQLQRHANGTFHFTFVSQGAAELFGRSAQQVTSDAECVLPALQPSSQGSFLAALDGSNESVSLSWEGFLLRPDQRKVPVHVQAHLSQSDNTLVWDGIVFDMTELNTARLKLHDSETRKSAVLEASNDAFFMTDSSGRILEGNAAAERIFETEHPGLLQRALGDLGFPDDEFADLAAYCRSQSHAPSPRRTLRLSRPHHHDLTVELSVHPLALQGGEFYSCHLRDITSRVSTEERLRRSNRSLNEKEERLRLALEAAEAGMWSWNITENTFYWDERLIRMFGLSPQTCRPCFETWLDLLHPEDRTSAGEAVEEALVRHGTFANEYRIVRPDGKIRVLRAQGKVERDDLECPRRMTGVCIDVTERRQAEAVVLEKNRDLETLLHVTSHDLREPLRAIQNFTRILAEEYESAIDSEGQDLLWRIVRAADRMDNLIDDILLLSRAQRRDITMEAVSGNKIVQRAVDELEESILEHQATVTVADHFEVLHADQTWATQAVYNLISNALKFTREGETPEIHVQPWRAPAGADDEESPETGIMVSDRGPGVQAEHAERIFRLFQRAVKRDVRGTGAGLAIVSQVAQRHGGRAWVQPRQGGGSEFIITFGKETTRPTESTEPQGNRETAS